MEENVALDSKKQRKFVKSIKGIQKLIKKNEKIAPKSEPKKQEEIKKKEKIKKEKPFSMRLKNSTIKKKKRSTKGLVYLSHIPHGFYEHQMTEYFKQFGMVTNARVIKSKRTGASKGYAFVEFKDTSVAEIVAETMNNYLMGKRLIKAVYIPPEKQKRNAFRKNWNSEHNPTSIRRLELKKAFNADKDDKGDLKKAKKLLSNLNKTKKRLADMGIDYEFTPVDVPVALLDQVGKKENSEDTEECKTESKKKKKENVAVKEDKKGVKNEKVQQNTTNDKKVNKKIEKGIKPNEINKKGKQQEKKVANKENIKTKKPVKVNETQQKEKEQKLKDAGVKSVEEFIKLDADDDSDDSDGFDSDEYEKMLEDDDDDVSSGETEESGEEESEGGDDSEVGDDDCDDEEEVPALVKAKGKLPLKGVQPPIKSKGKPPPILARPAIVDTSKPLQKDDQPNKAKKKAQKQQPQTQQGKKQDVQPHSDVKRKSPQQSPVAAKKPKFEKQNQKQIRKQFKKK